MKLAVISDIHGNLAALEQVLGDLKKKQVAKIVCLGDNVGYGPEPDAVVRSLRQRAIASIMGNHELAIHDRKYRRTLNFITRKSVVITEKLLGSETRTYLAGLPAAMVMHGARFVHGCPPDSITTYLFKPSSSRLKTVFSAFPEALCFFGHTHCLALFSHDGAEVSSDQLPEGVTRLQPGRRYLVNAGSVGQPRDRYSNSAKYIIWDLAENTLEVRSVPYDIQRTAAAILALGFPESNARRLWDAGP